MFSIEIFCNEHGGSRYAFLYIYYLKYVTCKLKYSTLNMGNPTTLKTTDYKILKREHRNLIYISKVTSQYMESAQNSKGFLSRRNSSLHKQAIYSNLIVISGT